MEREQVFELLPAKETEAVMEAMELFQWIFLLLNLNWFLANQMEFMMLMIAAFTTSLDWWLEYLLLVYQMSSYPYKSFTLFSSQIELCAPVYEVLTSGNDGNICIYNFLMFSESERTKTKRAARNECHFFSNSLQHV